MCLHFFLYSRNFLSDSIIILISFFVIASPFRKSILHNVIVWRRALACGRSPLRHTSIVGCLAAFPCYLPPLFGYVIEILVAHFIERCIALSHEPLRNERFTVRVIGRTCTRTEMVAILLSTICEAERVLQNVQFFVGYFHFSSLSLGRPTIKRDRQIDYNVLRIYAVT